MSHSPEYPFHKVWFRRNVDWNRFTRIYIAPVNNEHLLKAIDNNSAEYKSLKKDAEELGYFTQRNFVEAFTNDPAHRYRLVTVPGPGALILEIALTEMSPHEVALEAATYAGGPAVGVVGWLGGGLIRSSIKDAIAFEARLRSGDTGEVIAMFADREAGKQTIINVRGLSRYGYAKAVIDEWAKQFVRVLNKKPGEQIPDSEPFDLKLW